MDFPSTDDFLQEFGISPVEEEPSMAYCRYVKASSGGELEVDVSFSAVSESFQVVLRCNGNEVAKVSSEKVKSIEIRQDVSCSGIYVVFDIHGLTSAAWIELEPRLNFRWWALRSA